jgi:UDP-N-acetylglucosamine 1-carboxyvinyltransferase
MLAIRSLGVQAVEHIDEAICTAPDGLIGGRVMLDPTYRSPGATFNALLTAVLAAGQTVIDFATEDPEMTNLCEFLINAGAKITGVGTRKVIVDGVEKLHDVQHTLSSDRIEGGTFLLAGAATRGKVTVGKINPADLSSLTDIFSEMGIKVEKGDDYITVNARGVKPVGTIVSTQPFPGFPTDLQPPLVAMMCLAEGLSVVHENIYSGRMGYVNELRKMGARIKVEENKIANIEGIDKLDGRLLEPTDMRAGAALVIAALSAQGESIITGRHFIVRGYENLEKKLKDLGAKVDVKNKN